MIPNRQNRFGKNGKDMIEITGMDIPMANAITAKATEIPFIPINNDNKNSTRVINIPHAAIMAKENISY